MSYSLFSPLALPSLSKIFLSTFRNRGRFGIMVDILSELRDSQEGMTKTHIMQQAKLNYKQVKRFINILMVCDLIRAEPIYRGERKLTRYALTHHGLEFLEILQNLHFSAELMQHRAI